MNSDPSTASAEKQITAACRHIQAATKIMGTLLINVPPGSGARDFRAIDSYQEIFNDLLKLRNRLS